jgi:hypothetical protein
MAGRMQQRRSITATTVPGAGDINQGELFVNINPADKKAYVKLSDNSIFELAGSSYALLASPAFTGTPTAPTATGGTNTTQIATTAFVQGELSSISSSAVTYDVNQTTHGFSVGDVVRYTGSAYTEAQADSAANAETVGFVSAVADANNFTLQLHGRITGLSSLTAGSVYFLSETTAGGITATEPSGVNEITKPMLIADSTTSGFILHYRGQKITSSFNTAAGAILAKNETSHGLAVGDWVRFNGTSHVKAQADSAANAETVGVVVAVDDVDNFQLQINGYVTGLSSLTAGTVYFLDPSTSGALTSTEPSTSGQISKPLLQADTTTSGYMLTYRGQEQ